MIQYLSAVAALFCTLNGTAPAWAGGTGVTDASNGEILSIGALREYTTSVDTTFMHEYDRDPAQGLGRRVVSFSADGLKQYALIITPSGHPPDSGWPVVIANHGHHPDPPENGRVNGVSDRPGDYYRQVPLAFAHRGFMVVMPDFRGHNISEGLEFTGGFLESYWYSRDTVAAFSALDSLPLADPESVFMWGHSMGGEVTLRVALALGRRLSAASIWSPSIGSPWDKAMHSHLGTDGVSDSHEMIKPAMDRLQQELDGLPFTFDPETGNSLRFIGELQVPLSIQHAIGDLASTPYTHSVLLAVQLHRSGKKYQFHSYPGGEHMFQGERLLLAVSRDAIFFRSYLVRR